MADYGIKFSQKGVRFDTPDSDKSSIDSGNSALKIIDRRPQWAKAVLISSGAYNNTYSIQHGLGYIPLFDFYFKDLSGRLIHLPGKSLDTYGTRGRILSETVDEFLPRIGRPSAVYPADAAYDVYQMIFLDPEQ